MDRRPPSLHIRRFVRDHERTLVAVFLLGLVLFGGVASIGIVVRKIRVPVLDGVEQIVNYWDDRWSRRVEYGERLVSAKKYSQAVEYLVALDRGFPAQNVRHKRDGERERLLQALGHSYSEMGKKRLALDTYRRLVEFDPRNFESRYLLAQTCLRFGETKMAEEQFAGVLKFHPTHMPSVRAYLTSHFSRGDFAAVVAAYETYLNAFLIKQVTVALGQSSIKVNVPVDGRFHDFDVRLTNLPESSGELMLQVGEFAIEIKAVAIEAALLVGKTGAPITAVWPGQSSWRAQEIAPIGVDRYRALGPGAALRLELPPQPRGIAAIHLKLRLFKPLDPDLWGMVEKSHKNLLRYNDLEAVRARSLIDVSNGAGL